MKTLIRFIGTGFFFMVTVSSGQVVDTLPVSQSLTILYKTEKSSVPYRPIGQTAVGIGLCAQAIVWSVFSAQCFVDAGKSYYFPSVGEALGYMYAGLEPAMPSPVSRFWPLPPGNGMFTTGGSGKKGPLKLVSDYCCNHTDAVPWCLSG